MRLIKKFENTLHSIDETTTQLEGKVFLSLFLLFLMVAFFTSVGNVEAIAQSLESYIALKQKEERTNHDIVALNFDVKAAKNKLPYANLISLEPQANIFIIEKINLFNIYNGFNINANLIDVKSNGITPYYEAKIYLNGLSKTSVLVALIYFEKIGFIQEFSNNQMILEFQMETTKRDKNA